MGKIRGIKMPRGMGRDWGAYREKTMVLRGMG